MPRVRVSPLGPNKHDSFDTIGIGTIVLFYFTAKHYFRCRYKLSHILKTVSFIDTILDTEWKGCVNMSDSFQIIDRFIITGRGLVYAVKPTHRVILKVGDILSDLHGNKFRVAGIDMPTRCWNYLPPAEELPFGILVEQLDGVEAEGDTLIHSFANSE